MFWKVLMSMVAGAMTFALGASSFAMGFDLNQCEKRTFKLTSYYSPIAGQDFYYRGNLTDERILNGEGTHGASGRGVFNGMIAASSDYEFGTRIYFPGMGVGEVQDRGQAIVNKGERVEATFDRIDIWADRGEAGLERALSFGVQTRDGYICPHGVIPDQQVGFDYSTFPSYGDQFFEASLRMLALRPGREGPRVKALQVHLIDLGYMKSGRNTGFFGAETKAAVCQYQQDWIGISPSSEYCGWFGQRTRYHMKNRLKELGIIGNFKLVRNYVDQTEEGIAVAENAPVQQALDAATSQTRNERARKVNEGSSTILSQETLNYLFEQGEFKHYKFLEPLKKDDKNKTVKVLQRYLAWLGYIDIATKVSGEYDVQTIAAVYEFQLDNEILDGTEDPSIRGYFGPSTREMLNARTWKRK